MDGEQIVASGALHLIPLDNINGYDVRPGFYEISGATALREGVNFTVCSLEAFITGVTRSRMQFFLFRSIIESAAFIR